MKGYEKEICEADNSDAYGDGARCVYSKLKNLLGMESDFCNCLRIDDLLTPLSKKQKKTEERQIN